MSTIRAIYVLCSIVILMACVAACGTVVMPTPVSAESTPDTATLRDVLSGENCTSACFMDIEPGVTSREELEAILDGLGISYDVTSIGQQGMITLYVFVPQIVSPFIFREDGIGVLLGGDQVDQIDINVTGVTLNDILNWFGTPTHIVQAGGESYNLLYASDGLLFHLSSEDLNVVNFLYIRTETSITGAFASRGDIRPCAEPAVLCSIATATPAPSPTANP